MIAAAAVITRAVWVWPTRGVGKTGVIRYTRCR
jgi:hypothetical protein